MGMNRLEQTLAIGVSMLAATSCHAPVPGHPIAAITAPIVAAEDDQPAGPAAPDAGTGRIDRASGSVDARRWRFASFFNRVKKQVAERRLVDDDRVVRFNFGFLYDPKGGPQSSPHDVGDGGDSADGEAWPRRDAG
jgi:hypothetical protein